MFKAKTYKLYRGLSVLAAFFSALFIGLMLVSSISDYKVLINDILGVKGSSSVSIDNCAYISDYSSTSEMLAERKRIAEQISAEGSVLLKNNGALPIGKGKNVTVLGSRAYTYDASGNRRDDRLVVYGGIVGSVVYEQSVVTTDGKYDLPITLETGLNSEGISINPALKNYYTGKPFPSLVAGSEANGSSGEPFAINEPGISVSDCGSYSQYNDACIVMIGRSSGEGREYLPGSYGVRDSSDGSKGALGLSDAERNLINVAAQISDKVIVLINSAVAMEIDDLKEGTLADKVDAVLWIGLPGLYGMNGVAQIISGEVSPSGHLPDVYAVDASASPAAQNFGPFTQDGSAQFVWSNAVATGFKDQDNSHYTVLAEGIYTGYRYYETRYADCVAGNAGARSAVGIGHGESGSASWNYDREVSYSFGYGMSYASFEQSIVDGSLAADWDAKTVSVDVKVKNTSPDVTAKDVVQLYVSSPYTDYDREHGVEKSAIQLVGFEKTNLLAPGEETTLTVTCEMKYFASYDKTVVHDGVTGGYILEEGTYGFAVGNGAHEALNNILAKKGVAESELFSEAGATVSADRAVLWEPTQLSGVNSSLFAVSNGYTVKNQMSDVDYNHFNPGTVTYLTRNDWAGTFPRAYTGFTVVGDMSKYLSTAGVYSFSVGSSPVEFGIDHSEDEDDEGNPLKNLSIAEMKLAAYDDERWDYLVSQITFDEAWALSPYGGTSCNPFFSVNAPEVWQIDGPNGNVSRPLSTKSATSGSMAVLASDPNANYRSADMCCEPVTAATFNKELVNEQGEIYGEEMLWSGNPIIWAPGMNLHRTPFNSRNHEYYSEDPMLTNLIGRSFIEGGISKGAILSAKHFAFNVQESFREGLCQFMEEQSARELELRGFQCIGEDGASFVNSAGNRITALGIMTSFSRVGVCGVNAHTGVMKNILRCEWGFRGLSSTDMVVGGRFFNPQDSIINNVTFMATSNADNLLSQFWPAYNDKSKVKNDPKLMQALYENMHYYMYAIANSSALNGFDANTVITETVYGWQKVITALVWVFFALSVVLIAGAVACYILNRKPLEGKACNAEPASPPGPEPDTEPANTIDNDTDGGNGDEE